MYNESLGISSKRTLLVINYAYIYIYICWYESCQVLQNIGTSSQTTKAASSTNFANRVPFLILHVEHSSTASGISKREWVVLPLGRKRDAVPEYATRSTIRPSGLFLDKYNTNSACVKDFKFKWCLFVVDSFIYDPTFILLIIYSTLQCNLYDMHDHLD